MRVTHGRAGRGCRSERRPVVADPRLPSPGRPARPRRGRSGAAGAGWGCRRAVDARSSRPYAACRTRARLRWSTVSSARPKPAGAPPADLDDDERRRRARVDRHEVELVAADMDVPGQDGPARRRRAGSGPAPRRRHPPAGPWSGSASRSGHPCVERVAGDALTARIRRLVPAARDVRCGTGRQAGADSSARGRSRSKAASSAMTGTSSRSSSSCGRGRRRRVAEQVEVELVAGQRALEGQERPSVERRQAESPGSASRWSRVA